ncbi:MAG: hypothetical protein Q8K18_19000 [Burkholderiales bacterium]|nr:hypothetical protein [Burkholderiales bacterium]
MNKTSWTMLAPAALLALGLSWGVQAEPSVMTFFITSAGTGKGADLGGLAGADKLCQTLASAAGAGKRTWRAYLSTSAADGRPAVNARERIGKGPWHNAQGRLIARNVAELHGINNISRMTALTEKGERVNGRAESPNMHDILTGSQPDGTAYPSGKDTTCGNWTKSGEGSAQVGHHDRWGLKDDEPSRSWNSSHLSRGCSQDNLRASGGAGMLYCFAAK